jgi:hypothetical protein
MWRSYECVFILGPVSTGCELFFLYGFNCKFCRVGGDGSILQRVCEWVPEKRVGFINETLNAVYKALKVVYICRVYNYDSVRTYFRLVPPCYDDFYSERIDNIWFKNEYKYYRFPLSCSFTEQRFTREHWHIFRMRWPPPHLNLINFMCTVMSFYVVGKVLANIRQFVLFESCLEFSFCLVLSEYAFQSQGLQNAFYCDLDFFWIYFCRHFGMQYWPPFYVDASPTLMLNTSLADIIFGWVPQSFIPSLHH